VWRQDTTAAAEPYAKLSRRAVQWALEALVLQHLTVARVAEALDVAWDTANDAVLAEGRRVLIADPARFDNVTVLGVDEHAWRHTRRGDRYVTVIIDLTPIRNGTGPSRLLDMVEGRSKSVFGTWLAERDQAWRDNVEVVAMDGFTGFKTATAEELPDATAVMDPSMSSASPGTRWTGVAVESNRTSTAIAAAPTTRCTGLGGPCTPVTTCSPSSRPRG
jgi:transposase